METISSKWTFSSPGKIFGCGIDSERIDRFADIEMSGEWSFPFVFSRREYTELQLYSNPRTAFCASFCCKEAVHKVVGEYYNYTECVLRYQPGRRIAPIEFGKEFTQAYTVSHGIAEIVQQPSAGEITVSVVLFE